MSITRLILLAACALVAACRPGGEPAVFEPLSRRATGIDFANTLREDDSVYNANDFDYLYNGGGVGVGDLNGDGLPDLYFAGNMVSSRLYLNRGGLRFEDVTGAAGAGTEAWATGVSMVDIDQDGLLDVYVCVAGKGAEADRANLLFVNRGVGPDWDGRTIVVTGTSMGGQQSLAAAGLNPRVTALIVHVPAGADVAAALHGRAPSYPHWNVSRPEVLRTARYFDAAHFASRITVPSLVSMGFIDELTTPASIWAAFNQIRGPKEAVPLSDAPHNHLATERMQLPYTRRAAEWLDVLVRGGDPTAAPR